MDNPALKLDLNRIIIGPRMAKASPTDSIIATYLDVKSVINWDISHMLLTGNDLAFVTNVIQHLSNQFHIKDLGDLHFFL
ncbi:hypothetical protein SADUNF_Sadunf03G0095000 [Salix dunnii]|uniref:Uncharacterized protein n=1 Tax=Salix dunnii TaxID=1413687 RepID=A0A835KGP7_9ROSI|nr:hypothetical protein SADUNF_Sadunf03G0095000 [Salix dunnii]